MKNITDLENGSIKKLVLRLAIPTMIAQFVNVFYGIIDRMYIGNIKDIGDLALAGVGVCSPIITLLTSFGTLIGIGGSILLAMRLGEKNIQSAKAVLANSFFALVCLSGILTVIFLLLKDYLLRWFGCSDATLPFANTYLTIYTIGTFFALMTIGLNSFIIAQGFSTIGMATVLIGAILNIILDPIFIFSLKMDVAGAALATVISQMISCFFVLLFLFSKQAPIRITFGNYSFSLIKRIVALGLSPFMILATDSVILIGLNYVLQKYGGPSKGDTLIACSTIIQSYMTLITSPMLGITGGTQPIISYNYGAKQTKRVKEAIQCILLLCLTFTTLMFILTRFLPPYFVQIFTKEPEHIALSVWGIKLFTFAIIPLSFQYTFVDALTALGETKIALSLSLFRKSLFIICTFALPTIFMAKYAFAAEPIADFTSFILSTTTFCIIFPRCMRKRESVKL